MFITVLITKSYNNNEVHVNAFVSNVIDHQLFV